MYEQLAQGWQVVARKWNDRESKPRPSNRESNALTITPSGLTLNPNPTPGVDVRDGSFLEEADVRGDREQTTGHGLQLGDFRVGGVSI